LGCEVTQGLLEGKGGGDLKLVGMGLTGEVSF